MNNQPIFFRRFLSALLILCLAPSPSFALRATGAEESASTQQLLKSRLQSAAGQEEIGNLRSPDRRNFLHSLLLSINAIADPQTATDNFNDALVVAALIAKKAAANKERPYSQFERDTLKEGKKAVEAKGLFYRGEVHPEFGRVVLSNSSWANAILEIVLYDGNKNWRPPADREPILSYIQKSLLEQPSKAVRVGGYVDQFTQLLGVLFQTLGDVSGDLDSLSFSVEAFPDEQFAALVLFKNQNGFLYRVNISNNEAKITWLENSALTDTVVRFDSSQPRLTATQIAKWIGRAQLNDLDWRAIPADFGTQGDVLRRIKEQLSGTSLFGGLEEDWHQTLQRRNGDLRIPSARLDRAVKIDNSTDLGRLLKKGGSLLFLPDPDALEQEIDQVEKNRVFTYAVTNPQFRSKSGPNLFNFDQLWSLSGYVYIPPGAGLEETYLAVDGTASDLKKFMEALRRARPGAKILSATNLEDAIGILGTHKDEMSGVVSEYDFGPRLTGIGFLRLAREAGYQGPFSIQSDDVMDRETRQMFDRLKSELKLTAYAPKTNWHSLDRASDGQFLFDQLTGLLSAMDAARTAAGQEEHASLKPLSGVMSGHDAFQRLADALLTDRIVSVSFANGKPVVREQLERDLADIEADLLKTGDDSLTQLWASAGVSDLDQPVRLERVGNKVIIFPGDGLKKVFYEGNSWEELVETIRNTETTHAVASVVVDDSSSERGSSSVQFWLPDVHADPMEFITAHWSNSIGRFQFRLLVSDRSFDPDAPIDDESRSAGKPMIHLRLEITSPKPPLSESVTAGQEENTEKNLQWDQVVERMRQNKVWSVSIYEQKGHLEVPYNSLVEGHTVAPSIVEGFANFFSTRWASPLRNNDKAFDFTLLQAPDPQLIVPANATVPAGRAHAKVVVHLTAAVPGEKVRVMDLKELLATQDVGASELAQQVATRGNKGVALLPREALDRQGVVTPSRTIAVYTHTNVTSGVMVVLPIDWTTRSAVLYPLDQGSFSIANRQLELAAQQEQAGNATVVIGLDRETYIDQAGYLKLNRVQGLKLLLDPKTQGQLASQLPQLQAFFSHLEELAGQIIDLTSGSIRVVTIEGHEYYALDIAA